MTLTWDELYINMALLMAMKSKDPRTKIGAVIVMDGVMLGTGFNGLPRGIEDSPGRLATRGHAKQWWFEHAERNAIYNAARHGHSTDLATMYTNGTPCVNCARAIIQSGIGEIVVDEYFNRRSNSLNYQMARSMLNEAGIKIRYVSLFPVQINRTLDGETIVGGFV